MIIKKINSMKGLSFVYTEYKTLEGIGCYPFVSKPTATQNWLEKDETGEFQLPKDFDPKVPHFAVWASSDEQSELIRKIYNNEFDGLPVVAPWAWRKWNWLICVAMSSRHSSPLRPVPGDWPQECAASPYGTAGNPVRLDQVKGAGGAGEFHIEPPKKDRTVEIYTARWWTPMRKKDAIIDRDHIHPMSDSTR